MKKAEPYRCLRGCSLWVCQASRPPQSRTGRRAPQSSPQYHYWQWSHQWCQRCCFHRVLLRRDTDRSFESASRWCAWLDIGYSMYNMSETMNNVKTSRDWREYRVFFQCVMLVGWYTVGLQGSLGLEPSSHRWSWPERTWMTARTPEHALWHHIKVYSQFTFSS